MVPSAPSPGHGAHTSNSGSPSHGRRDSAWDALHEAVLRACSGWLSVALRLYLRNTRRPTPQGSGVGHDLADLDALERHFLWRLKLVGRAAGVVLGVEDDHR